MQYATECHVWHRFPHQVTHVGHVMAKSLGGQYGRLPSTTYAHTAMLEGPFSKSTVAVLVRSSSLAFTWVISTATRAPVGHGLGNTTVEALINKDKRIR